ncbi:lipoprotein [Spiroplasma alleghenense]|uniref:Lipoprotein n=1 Tax=Spiroplasma alleghenense TaxID=216931 RepID=A0A345Z274_9MOLU|nr:lipoprotein [Spiroplasma alleghenense]AXK50703.1 hypothetical protein SALLE_v1c00270 [Spiroplasma alleghenense]
MKKLLSILGAVTLTASTSLSVISCSIPTQRVDIFVGKNAESDNFKKFDGPNRAISALSADILNVLNFKKEMYPDEAKYQEQKKLRQNKDGKLFSFEELFANNDAILTGEAKEDFWREYNEPFNTSFSQVTYDKNEEDSNFQLLDLTVIRSIVPEGKTDGEKIKFLRAETPKDDKELKDFEKHKANTAKILKSSDLPTGINDKIDQMTGIGADPKPELKYVKKEKDDEGKEHDILLYRLKDEEVLTPYVREVESKEIKFTTVAADVVYSFDVDDFDFEIIFQGHENKYKITSSISGLSGVLGLTGALANKEDNTEGINTNFYWYLRQYQFNNNKIIGTGSPDKMEGKFDNLNISKIEFTKI